MPRSIDLSSVLAASLAVRRPRTTPGQPQPKPIEDRNPGRLTAPARDAARQLIQAVRGIRPDDPQRERKAFRLFLEVRLLDDLGRELMADPGFSGFVDEVMARMEADPQLRSSIRTAGRALLTSAEGP